MTDTAATIQAVALMLRNALLTAADTRGRHTERILGRLEGEVVNALQVLNTLLPIAPAPSDIDIPVTRKPEPGKHTCAHCGRGFQKSVGLGRHLAWRRRRGDCR